jgi:hypothetical protein
MTDGDPIPTDLEPGDQEFGERLRSERAVPAAGFRGALGRHLAARDPGYGPRPARLRLMVAAYLGSGAAVVAIAALGATGSL